MFVKNVNYVFNVTKDGKTRAIAGKAEGGFNFVCVYERIGATYENCKISSLNFCTSYKAAEHIADVWNEAYKENGTLLPWNEVICN